ncbi:MAG TPA: hypothetical protein VMT16_09440 [Thermoanaerobaculia bacterium]|nr:hypothetical protein [Thermoanaerobaculia bacterium]
MTYLLFPSPPRVLLGPQRLRPFLVEAVRRAGIEGPIGVVTAGWQEREEEVDELREHLGRRVVNLRLYQRAEQVLAGDRELFRAYRDRQERLRRLQELYRLRLAYALDAVRDLQSRRLAPELLEPERSAAIATVRALDAHHLARIAEVHAAFAEAWRPMERDSVARHRQELAALAAQCAAFGVAGGHVAVLLNRLRLFGVGEMMADKPLFAWSGGAMVLARRLVLFHDHPPQGRGNAEVLEAGLGLVGDVLPLPHARRRLDLADPSRVALLASRFAGEACLTLDDGAELSWNGSRWRANAEVRKLLPDGTLTVGPR